MKASNWLSDYVRHTRTGDRSYKQGEIEGSYTGIRLKSDGKYLDIELSDKEIKNLIIQLKNAQTVHRLNNKVDNEYMKPNSVWDFARVKIMESVENIADYKYKDMGEHRPTNYNVVGLGAVMAVLYDIFEYFEKDKD